MKRILPFICLLIISLSSFISCADFINDKLNLGVASGSSGSLEWSWNLFDQTLSLTGTADSTEPFTYKQISGLNYSKVKTITIGSGITALGDHAFSCFTNAESISIPESVTSVGEGIFKGLTSSTKIEIASPTTFPSSSSSWYEGYSGLIALINGDKLNIYGDGDITASDSTYIKEAKDAKVTSISMADGITSISNADAFAGLTTVTMVTLSNALTTISDYMFESCNNLTSITIPSSVTYIGVYAFAGCTTLSNITIPDSVTHIGDSAFYNCTKLTSITIPSDVTYIGASAFAGCTTLSTITIQGAITHIGDGAFYNCTKLTPITIPSSVTYIGASAFYSWVNSQTITLNWSSTDTTERDLSGLSSSITSLCGATIKYNDGTLYTQP